MSKSEEHVSYWRMYRQGWEIMWSACIVFLVPLVLPCWVFIRERGVRPVWIEAVLDLAGLVYVVFGLPFLVWVMHRARLRNSAAYRLDGKAKHRQLDEEKSELEE